MRAGKLVLGFDPTLTAIRGNKVQLAFPKWWWPVKQKFADKAAFYHVTLIQLYKAQLTDAIGVNGVFAIADRGFSRKLNN